MQVAGLAGGMAVVTGAAGGIGAAMARRFAAEGAAVVVVDLDDAAVQRVAREVGGRGYGADVADREAVAAVVDHVEDTLGPVTLFAANAGVVGGEGLDLPDEVWDLCWRVNVLGVRNCAQVVVPRMLARGGGTFVVTASAAGLLTNLGNAPYSVTKHASVALAEWLSIAYGDAGLRVHCLCPMGVETAMLQSGDGTLAGESVRAMGVVTPDDAASAVVDAMVAGRFLALTHPQVALFEQMRAGDRDRWLAGMRRAQRDLAVGRTPTGG